MANAGPSASGEGSVATRILFPILVLVVVLSRLWGLDHQAFHHDESIHCKAIWDLARQGPDVYHYDPVYHGPLFYHLGALTSCWLPDTDFTARLPFALSGLALVGAALLLAPAAGWRIALLAMALLTVSPTVTYYSRFAREDVVMVALLAWIVGAGTRYFQTRRLRWLTLAWLCMVLCYCNKENSYVNGFLVCSFLVLSGVWKVVRSGRAGLRAIFLDHLPLTRLLIVFGCFSLFVFMFVAVDARVGPETSLSEGASRILRHSVALSREAGAAAKELSREQGYFTAAGRGNVAHVYGLLAFATTIALLVGAETISARARGCTWRRVGAVAGLATAGYTGAGLWLAQFVHWAATHSGQMFLSGLRRELLAGWLILSGLALLSILPVLWSASIGRRSARQKPRWRAFVRLGTPTFLGLWVLAFQMVAAICLYCFLFSSMGTNAPAGLRAGLHDYVAYWFRQQTGEFRIWGEWWYYLPRLALYEAPALLAIVTCGISLLRRRTGFNRPAFHLTVFAAWITVGMVIVYALLNEKVGWLAIYQAYALNLLAALLVGRWMEARGTGRRERIAIGAALVLGLGFACWQHSIAVHLRPDSPTEPMAFVTTSRSYLEEIRRVERAHWSAVNSGREPPLVSLSGEAVWPGAWYLRRLKVSSSPFAQDAAIQIMSDSPENRNRLDIWSDFVWEQRPAMVRGWWFSHGEGLPAGGSLVGNMAAAVTNEQNDHRDAFQQPDGPPDRYPARFAEQLVRFAFFRTEWYPSTGSTVLFAWRTDRQAQRQGTPVWLEGFDREPRAAEVRSQMDGGDDSLNAPRAVCVLPDGQLAVADSSNGRICILDEEGSIVQTFGEGVLSKEVTGPCGLAIGPDGTFYVADTWNHAIRAFSPEGKLLASCTTMPLEGPAGRLFGPRGIAVSTGNNSTRVYATDTGNSRVVVLDANLTPLLMWGYPGRGPGLLDEPVGIVADASGDIFVADTGNGRIQQFDRDGAYLREFPVYIPDKNERIAAEPQLTLLPDGERIAMTYATRGVFIVISPRETRAWPWKPAGPEVEPSGIAFSPDWGLYLADRRSGSILRLGDGRDPNP